MANPSLRYAAEKLLLALFLRCPNCGKGKMFRGLFTMEQTCPNCDVRFERRSGESVGGMYINLGLAEFFSVGGFFLFQALFNLPWVPHLAFWILFNIAFVVLFYRNSRALWVAISYLTGGVYTDPDTPRTPTNQPPS